MIRLWWPFALAASVAVVATGCAGSVPGRAPDAVGDVVAVDYRESVVEVQFDHDPGYEYFEGTTFMLGEDVTITGAVDHAVQIRPDDRIGVWVDACAESFPVQCTVVAVEVQER